jgi:hypothetical protein
MHILVTYIYNRYKAYVSPVWEQQILLFLKLFRLQRQPSNLNGRRPDRHQVEAACTFCPGLRLVQYCEHLYFRGFVWLSFTACYRDSFTFLANALLQLSTFN